MGSMLQYAVALTQCVCPLWALYRFEDHCIAGSRLMPSSCCLCLRHRPAHQPVLRSR